MQNLPAAIIVVALILAAALFPGVYAVQPIHREEGFFVIVSNRYTGAAWLCTGYRRCLALGRAPREPDEGDPHRRPDAAGQVWRRPPWAPRMRSASRSSPSIWSPSQESASAAPSSGSASISSARACSRLAMAVRPASSFV